MSSITDEAVARCRNEILIAAARKGNARIPPGGVSNTAAKSTIKYHARAIRIDVAASWLDKGTSLGAPSGNRCQAD